MTELKTLKEIGFWDNSKEQNPHNCYECGFSMKNLKDEAIKWIKEIEMGDNPVTTVNDCPEEDDGAVKFIRHFFNITEDDLK